MSKDYIGISKKDNSNEYILKIYFSEVNSEINVAFKKVDFLKFLNESVKVVNANPQSFLLQIPEDIQSLINANGAEELQNLKQKMQTLEIVKPIAELIIYIPDHEVSLISAEAITNSSGDFMESLGFEMETEDEPVFGSFFKRVKFIFSRTIGNEDLEQLYSKGKKALELKYVELPTAEQTEKLANAAEKLINSLNGVNEGVIKCSGLIVIKKVIRGEHRIIVQQLSSELMILLEKQPQLLFNLNTIYELVTGDVNKSLNNSDSEEQVMIA